MTGENYLLVNQWDSIVAKSPDTEILKWILREKERIRIVKGKEGWDILRGDEGKKFMHGYGDIEHHGKQGYTYMEVWEDLTVFDLAKPLGYTVYKSVKTE